VADAPPPGSEARALVDAQRGLASRAAAVVGHVDAVLTQVARIVLEDRARKVAVELAAIDVEHLQGVTEANLRLTALTAGGYRTALDVRRATEAQLEALPGVGRQTARSVLAAVDELATAIGETKHVRISFPGDRGRAPSHARDTALPAPLDTELLTALARLQRLEPAVEPHRAELTGYATAVTRALPAARRAASRWRLALSGRRTRREARAALAGLAARQPWLEAHDLTGTLADLEARCATPDPGPAEVWADYARNGADYLALLERIVPGARDVEFGGLAAELAERVAAHPLDTSLLTVQLRGYQAFGARFVLNQGRVLLGDEMGLGKTVQAIAVMADRAASGQTHALVVCPASVLVGWEREVAAHSRLVPHRVHGPGRDAALARWRAEGGVAITTYEGLEHVPLPGDDAPALLVVDEAHYVKNPEAQRSRLVAAWAERTWRVLLMTGTPMHNRVEEFLELVRLLQPDVADAVPRNAGLAGPEAFRRAVTPVYLRRNQVDVLVELPDLVAAEEWVEATPEGERTYRAAVERGSFMAMRRAAYATADPRDSAKLERLLEIVEDAAENGHRVVVYSWFLDVLDVVTRALDAHPLATRHGPLTGDVPPVRRQDVIDAFSADVAGAVLVAQVQVGGVGLNIQAASVVVLCEPQLTPAAEDQAIARVHRMGQVRTVRVHRLLEPGGVDERIRALLAGKRRAFDEFVRESAVADGALRAVDVSRTDLARRVVAQEQARLGYGPVWDELEADDAPTTSPSPAPGGS
jgi:superfamily II DNA or RNA helicase